MKKYNQFFQTYLSELVYVSFIIIILFVLLMHMFTQVSDTPVTTSTSDRNNSSVTLEGSNHSITQEVMPSKASTKQYIFSFVPRGFNEQSTDVLEVTITQGSVRQVSTIPFHTMKSDQLVPIRLDKKITENPFSVTFKNTSLIHSISLVTTQDTKFGVIQNPQYTNQSVQMDLTMYEPSSVSIKWLFISLLLALIAIIGVLLVLLKQDKLPLFREVKQYVNRINGYYITVVCTILLYIIVEYPARFRLPQAYAEEATVFFRNAHEGGLISLFGLDYGYMPLAQNIISTLAYAIGGSSQYMNITIRTSLVIMALIIGLFTLKANRKLIENDMYRAVIVLVFILLTMDSSNLTFINFMNVGIIFVIYSYLCHLRKMNVRHSIILTVLTMITVLSKGTHIIFLPLFLFAIFYGLRNKNQPQLFYGIGGSVASFIQAALLIANRHDVPDAPKKDYVQASFFASVLDGFVAYVEKLYTLFASLFTVRIENYGNLLIVCLATILFAYMLYTILSDRRTKQKILWITLTVVGLGNCYLLSARSIVVLQDVMAVHAFRFTIHLRMLVIIHFILLLFIAKFIEIMYHRYRTSPVKRQTIVQQILLLGLIPVTMVYTLIISPPYLNEQRFVINNIVSGNNRTVSGRGDHVENSSEVWQNRYQYPSWSATASLLDNTRVVIPVEPSWKYHQNELTTTLTGESNKQESERVLMDNIGTNANYAYVQVNPAIIFNENMTLTLRDENNRTLYSIDSVTPNTCIYMYDVQRVDFSKVYNFTFSQHGKTIYNAGEMKVVWK